MTAGFTEQILEMPHQESLLGQNYSIKNVSITAEYVVFECEKKEPIYCCPFFRLYCSKCPPAVVVQAGQRYMNGQENLIESQSQRLKCK